MTPKLKLIYADMPGRAECTRIMLEIGGVPYEDYHLDVSKWEEIKKTFPFEQVPVMEVDGKQLAQSAAIERFVGKLTGLYPSDPWEAAKVDELTGFQQDIMDLFMASYGIKDKEAKTKARQEVVAGPLVPKLAKLTSLLEKAGTPFFLGTQVTYADVLTYKNLSGLVSGDMDGVPTTLLDDWPVLKAFHDRVASLPAVAKRYEGVTEGVRLAYKPLA